MKETSRPAPRVSLRREDDTLRELLRTPTSYTRTRNTRNSRPIEILTDSELKALLRVCSARAATGLRNRALLVLGWRGGLRLGEALGLYPRDLDPVAGTVNVRRGKGGKQRLVGLAPPPSPWLSTGSSGGARWA